MSKDIYLNPNTDDIDLTNNRLTLTETLEDLTRQKVLINLSTYKGELFFDIGAGIPYLKNDFNERQLLTKGSKTALDVEIRLGIISREGVVALRKYDSTLDSITGALTVSFEAQTEDGAIIQVSNVEI